jgi:hypothetical protein
MLLNPLLDLGEQASCLLIALCLFCPLVIPAQKLFAPAFLILFLALLELPLLPLFGQSLKLGDLRLFAPDLFLEALDGSHSLPVFPECISEFAYSGGEFVNPLDLYFECLHGFRHLALDLLRFQ